MYIHTYIHTYICMYVCCVCVCVCVCVFVCVCTHLCVYMYLYRCCGACGKLLARPNACYSTGIECVKDTSSKDSSSKDTSKAAGASKRLLFDRYRMCSHIECVLI